MQVICRERRRYRKQTTSQQRRLSGAEVDGCGVVISDNVQGHRRFPDKYTVGSEVGVYTTSYGNVVEQQT